ncbi:c-type cytochrome domain-containing protein [Ravibacter arvi]|uniref:c-type cytochrome domain-containing protein n=1 Tax=Ravibacter arvi TaxID=2051041 RepID=UPI0031EE5F10
MTDFIGRFHPVVVHLPIGILLLAALFQLLSRRFSTVAPAIPLTLLFGALGAVLSCITGYMLSLSGDYDTILAGRHQWLGIATAVLAFVFYGIVRYKATIPKLADSMALASIGLITLTGHLGGSLTHGEDYLTVSLSSENTKAGLPPIPNIQEAVLYTDVVQPILKNRCYSCHGPSKQKGKLRLDEHQYILTGGEDGSAIKAGAADESELIKRLLLPLTNDEHMPPKEKPQLTENEVAVLKWWVDTGAEVSKKVKDLKQTESIKPVLAALESGESKETPKISDIPEAEVAPADENAIQAIRKAGIIVLPVSQDKAYLSASFVTAGAGADTLIKLLEPIRKQLIWLRLDDAKISDKTLGLVAGFPNLTRLYLTNTAISDAGLAQLSPLKQLQVLNLVNTKVTEQGLLALKGLQSLRSIYLFQTAVDKSKWASLQTAFPKTVLDSGGYQVPTFETDTVEVKLQ